MKCLLSIDVGIKNLAICALQVPNGDIQFWKTYDLIDSASKKKEEKKKEDSEKQTGPCQTMLKKKRQICGKNGLMNTRGRAYCGTHDPARKHSPKDTQGWCWALIQGLPQILDDIIETISEADGEICEVVIERQSKQNLKMMMMSHLIYAHIVKAFDNDIDVRLVSARSKLQVYTGPEISCNLKTPYARRKYFARKHTEYILQQSTRGNEWLEKVFLGSKKQDDLADAFLQGLFHAKK